jgi:RNA polymerase sigma factor (sigma-70 family)
MQQLVDLLIKNDRKAQEKLYKIFADRMFLTCNRYVNNEDDAAEILNTGFYKAFTAIKSFEFINEIAFECWLRKIMINEALMFLRKKNKNELFKDIEPEIITNLSITENYMQTEDYYFLLQKLPAGYRMVFNLFAIEGYNHSEIAEILNISESTSRSQLSRARDVLQKLISKEI